MSGAEFARKLLQVEGQMVQKYKEEEEQQNNLMLIHPFFSPSCVLQQIDTAKLAHLSVSLFLSQLSNTNATLYFISL